MFDPLWWLLLSLGDGRQVWSWSVFSLNRLTIMSKMMVSIINPFNPHTLILFFQYALLLYFCFWSDGIKLGSSFSDFTASIPWILFMHSQQRGTSKTWHQVSSDRCIHYKSYVHFQVHSKSYWLSKFASRFFHLPSMPRQRFFFSRYLTFVWASIQLYWSSMNYLSVWRFQRIDRHIFSLFVGFTQLSMSYSLPRGS